MQDRHRQLNALLPQIEGDPRAMAMMARQLLGAGDKAQALALAERAFVLSGGLGEAGVVARELLSDGVPRWHFVIPRDSVRNDAYEAALRRAITPGCKVLEIGTGSGLLAMMAARAGAAQVVTCEADPSVAAAARAVIAANGFADRVTVVNKHSTALDPVADMGGLADILVSEIVSNDLLSEYTLAAHEDAVPRLLKPGGAVIPIAGTIRVALAADLRPRDNVLRQVSGFDLSAFNRVSFPYDMIGVGRGEVALRSAPADLFAFDFGSGGPWKFERKQLDLVSQGGRIDGVVQWIALDMDGAGEYENQPGEGAASCWVAHYWAFPNPIETDSGDRIAIGGAHERDRLRIWCNAL